MDAPNLVILAGCEGYDTLIEAVSNEVPMLVLGYRGEKFQTHSTQDSALKLIVANRCKSKW